MGRAGGGPGGLECGGVRSTENDQVQPARVLIISVQALNQTADMRFTAWKHVHGAPRVAP